MSEINSSSSSSQLFDAAVKAGLQNNRADSAANTSSGTAVASEKKNDTSTPQSNTAIVAEQVIQKVEEPKTQEPTVAKKDTALNRETELKAQVASINPQESEPNSKDEDWGAIVA